MTMKAIETTIEIFGKTLQVKCPESEVDSLKAAALYLEAKMENLRENGVANLDRLVMIAALNVVHQLLTLEQQKDLQLQKINDRLQKLQQVLDKTLKSEVIS